ncbi:hypothetical protein MCY_00245 [Bartonella rattimassiliensis 15908]|uniref:ABC transporter domain-containing protein n=1 Tax=Bartonella rattimassiliensis 15908 TaxID=1094556 RepID=J0QN37_9HYPH|nr:hypothetical protein MCY_00245 [Bartonella rattimassiliensis 15908]
MIEFFHVGVTFKLQTPLEKKALIYINLKIDQGSFVTVIGSNGAGKSTLLSSFDGGNASLDRRSNYQWIKCF